MRACGIFVLILIVLTKTTSAGGPCRKIENLNWYSFGSLKTCFMKTTTIDSKDFSVTSDRDVTVEGFYAIDNKNIEYLPNNLGAEFPNLLTLLAVACSIKEISRDNFKGLGQLRYLGLYLNQIEKIDDDTFEHLPAVEVIYLNYNKIKKLNGRAFASLHKLTTVDLGGNVCINENFYNAARIAEMNRIANEKCEFTDNEPSSTKTAKPEADLMAQSEELEALKMEIATLRIEKSKADLQIAHYNDIKSQHNEVKAQLKEICDARIELKAQEISNLSNDLQAKTEEINEKNEKIRQLEKKIQILGGDGPF